MQKTTLVLPLLLGLAAACTANPGGPTPDRLATVVAATLTAAVTVAPPETSAVIPSDKPEGPGGATFAPFYVLTSAQNVNLRTRPGTLFPVSRVMAQETRLQVLGRSPGGEWLNVLTDESILGWVQANLVWYGGDSPPPPVIEPTEVLVLRGRVTDAAGRPVSGIGFAVTQGAAANAPRTDATTDETGTFYAYLPLSAAGVWDVGYVSIDCTSNVIDADCDCAGGGCGEIRPPSVQVTLPLDGELDFAWK